MNTRSSAESPSTRSEILHPAQQLMESSTLLTNTMNQSQLGHMTQQPIILSSNLTGNNSSHPDLPSLEQEYQKLKETNSAKTLPSLQSRAKPHEILEKPQKLKVLKVNKEDILALCQMISEYREQFD